jgi:GT2 family glycosyltransferase
MDKPFVSVVIPVYNDGDRLTRCLQALYLQTYPYSRYEVVVVDNNSTQDLQGRCQQFPNVRYCWEPKQGNNAARNHGIAVAQGEIIAITDSDCIPSQSWIAEGVRSLQSHPQAGIIGGHIQFFFQGKTPTVVEYADRCFFLQQQVYVERDRYAAGANLFVRRAVIESVEGFDDRLLNLGDKEFGQRVDRAGWQVVYCAEAIVWHPARATLKDLLLKGRRQAGALRQLARLRGEKLPQCGFMPMGWEFWRSVWQDQNLPTCGEKLAFIRVMHCLKWVVARELWFGS